jgi:type I restriction enzyme R subunit
MRAVDKIVERTLDPEKTRGLIWHTQGSGKTFTMINAAQQILRHPAFEKPTVIMLVDRNELEGQLSGWIESVLGEGKAEIARSKQHLRAILQSDYRGLVISMIHKFDRADADLCTRDSVFILVDEAHRSTSAALGNYLVAAVPKATMVGFTGTPIDKIAYGKGTFKIFGKDDPQGYLDKYSIAESVNDGTTLELHYTLAPNDIQVPREQLEEEFLNIVEGEGVSDIEELNKILDKAVKLKAFLKASDRVEKVAQFVAKHFKENVEPLGYKAFLVGVDREACALYKKALVKYLPLDYSTVVYTAAHNDSSLLAEYHLTEDEEKKVRKAFVKKDVLPKILIVTEKLLTGFDAPILYCMYLDKPMRDHTLLQAIARVNRPYEEEGEIKKPAGFVVDFVGVFDNLARALAFDSEVVASVIKNIDVLKERFLALMRDPAPAYLALCQAPIDDKAVERAIDAFADKEKREKFYKLFKELEALYEIISPDPFLREHIDNYGNLSTLYKIVRNAFAKGAALDRDLAKKTEGLIRERAAAFGFKDSLPLVTIDEKALETLKRSGSSDSAKIINLGRSLAHTVYQEEEEQPYLLPIGERAEAVLEWYDDHQVSTQEALKHLEKLLSEYLEAKKEYEKSGFDLATFTIYWVLKQVEAPDPKKIAPLLSSAVNRFPNYHDNAIELRQLKAELYKLLLPAVGKERMVEVADRILNLRRK